MEATEVATTKPIIAAVVAVSIWGSLVAVANGQQPNTEQETPWQVGFVDGLPEGWQKGVAVLDDLPERVAGAVRASDGENIESHHQRVDGHFTVADGLYFNCRAVLSKPEWYQLFIFCKRPGQEAEAMEFYEYKPPVDRAAAGKRRVVSAPLSEFVCTTGPNQGNAPVPGEVCWMYSWGFQGRDLGMLIDLVWVTQGEPASVPAPEVKSDAQGFQAPTWSSEPDRDTFEPDANRRAARLSTSVPTSTGRARRCGRFRAN